MAVLLAALQPWAAPVDPTAAQFKAKQCLLNPSSNGRANAGSTLEPKLVLTQMGKVNATQAAFYVFNTDRNFVIVAGDDRAEEILAIGDRPLDVDRMPDNMKSLLDTYTQQIDYLLSYPDIHVEKPFRANGIPGAITVEPLLTALWDQHEPYWDQCVFNGYQCLTGCPATSASMVYHYWKYPTEPTPVVPGYRLDLNYSVWDTLMVDVPALPSVTFDWENMLDVYTNGYTAEQGNAVATLMRYVGQAERMRYGTSEMGGSGVSTDSVDHIAETFKFFGYDKSTVRTVKRMSNPYNGQMLYNDAEWAEIILDELIEHRPIVYTANSRLGGHAFNVDGYDADNNLYHVNFGWSGNGNGDFALNAFNDGIVTYNEYPQIIIGIQPTYDGPAVICSTNKMVVEAFTGELATQTLVIKGRNLTQDVTLTIEDDNGVFATDVTTVSLSDTQGDGKEITITYSPQTVGEHIASLVLSSNGAREATVRLIGTAMPRKESPVAIEPTEVGATSFRAVWTDETPASNVASYTLMVQQSGTPVAEEVASADFTSLNYTGRQVDPFAEFDTYCTPNGWTGNEVYPDRGGVRLGQSSELPVGYMVTPPLDLSSSGGKLTITFKAKGYGGNTGTASLVIKNGEHIISQALTNSAKTYTLVLDCDEYSNEIITFTSHEKRVFLYNVSITTTDVNNASIKAPVEQGDATSRTITGITDKSYLVTGLAPGATYHYRVKSTYVDDTESAWSTSAWIELLQDEWPRGDVDGNGVVDIADVNAVINVMLGKMQPSECKGNPNVDGQGGIDIADVNAVINIMLGKTVTSY